MFGKIKKLLQTPKAEQSNDDIKHVKALRDNPNERVYAEFYTYCRKYFYERKDGVLDFTACSAIDEHDIFQDSFLKLWEEIQSGKISLRDNCLWRMDRNGNMRRMTASLRTYMMAIAKYKNYENVREESKYVDDLVSAHDSIDEDQEDATADEIVVQSVSSLPPHCKEILTLFYYQGKSLKEIVEMRKDSQSIDGLKTAKSKCMSQLKKKILDGFKRNNLRPYANVQR